MVIIINGKTAMTTAANLQELVTELQLPERGVAVAINNRMVPRTEWATTMLTETSAVTIIKAAYGG